MTKRKIAETELYEPIKAFLSKQGYQVKSEIAGADIVAMRDNEPPVIVEMKTGFSLTLYHQATDRQSMTDNVYIAVPRGTGRAFLSSLKNNKRLCRRLGLGLLTVRMKDGLVEPHLDPAPYKPRQSKRKSGRLLREFATRVGDPNQGGINKKTIVTAYRQDAMLCLNYLSDNGPTKASDVAKAISVSRARAIMAADYYGWFERVERGIYSLTPKGEAAQKDHVNE